MSDDSGTGPRRVTIPRKQDKVALAQERSVESAPHGVSAASRPRLVEQPPRGRDAVTATISNAGIVSSQLKRSLALLRSLPHLKASSALESFIGSLPRVKVSPLLATFIGCVLAPAFAATVYFAFIASNQLGAEARFAVRQIEIDSTDTMTSTSNTPTDSASSSGSSGPSVSFSFTAPGQNAYIVTSYIRSRAIIDDLNSKLNLREIFRRPEADFWARLDRNASIDELAEYWDSMVNTYVDAPSGIVTLRVRAFRADDAVALANGVLELSETLVNRISDRARRDAMEMSEKEVRRTYEMTQAALAEMHRFRDSAGIINPVQAGTEIGKLLLPLLTEKIRIEGDLFVASRDLDNSAPTIRVLKNRLETTEQQIAQLKGRLTNTDGDSKSVAALLARFEELELKRQFAEKLYSLAQSDLDRARLRAARQSIYLTVFVPPSLPEESRYPRRVAFPILIFLTLMVIWAIGAMTVAAVEDHRL